MGADMHRMIEVLQGLAELCQGRAHAWNDFLFLELSRVCTLLAEHFDESFGGV